jgi:DNA-binding NarL/FixJ family response regulator
LESGSATSTLLFSGTILQVSRLAEKNDTFGILVVDDHPVMRDGLRAVIEQEPDMEVVGEAADGREAIGQFQKLLPDVMLIDLQMPDVDGLQAITTIRGEFPDATIIVLTTFPGDARVVRAFTLGATSYLLKTARRDEIIKAIRGALSGRHTVAPEVAQEIASHTGQERLTEREIGVLKLVAKGRSNRDIADALCISEDTVKARMKSIMGKLDAEDRTHAVMIAIRRGFMDSQP